MSSSRPSDVKPTQAVPLRTPIVAGIAPFWRTKFSKFFANAVFCGYGNPDVEVRRTS